MKKLKLILLIIVYIFLSWTTAGGHFAYLQGEYQSKERYREDLAFAIGISILPPSWIVAPISTGFYKHGIDYKFTNPE